MCAHDIFDLDAPVEIFIYLNVIVRVGCPHSLVVVLFREKARRSEHDAGKPLVPMKQLAKILRCRLGHAIDVLRNRRDLLGDPGGRSSSRQHQGVAKDAGCAREDKRPDTCRHRLFQQIERASDVGVDEVLPAMSGDMRLMQGGRMEDCLHATRTTPHARAVGYRADMSRKWRVNDVEADDLVFQVLQGAGQGLAQMTGASCNQDSHARITSRLSLSGVFEIFDGRIACRLTSESSRVSTATTTIRGWPKG